MERPATIEVPFVRGGHGADIPLDAHRVDPPPGYVAARPHVLDFYEIQFVTSGRLPVRLGGESTSCHSGQVLFTPPREVRRLPALGGADGQLLCVAPDAVPDGVDPFHLHRLSFFRVTRPSAVLDLSVGDRRWLLDRIEAMADELTAVDRHTVPVLGGMLTEVLHRLDRLYARRHGELDRRRDSRVERFVDLVDERFAATRRVDDYARLLALSPAHLNHLVRRDLGHSPKAFIRQRVVVEARRLLAHTELSVQEIASRLGFEEPSYFSRFFHRATGFRPSDARELYDA